MQLYTGPSCATFISTKIYKNIPDIFMKQFLGSDIKNNTHDIPVIDTDIYDVLVLCDEEDLCIKDINIFTDISDVIKKQRVANKYTIDINHEISEWIETNLVSAALRRLRYEYKLKKFEIQEETYDTFDFDKDTESDSDISQSNYPEYADTSRINSRYMKIGNNYKYLIYNLNKPLISSDEIYELLLHASRETMYVIYKYICLEPMFSHMIFDKLFDTGDYICLYESYTMIAINLLYLRDLNMYSNSVEDDTHIIKNIHDLTVMKNLMYMRPNIFKVRIALNHVLASFRRRVKGRTTIGDPRKITLDNIKNNILQVSNGLLDDDFDWYYFRLCGSAVYASLVCENDIFKYVNDLDIICVKKSADDDIYTLLELCKTKILPRMNSSEEASTEIIHGKKTSRIRITHPSYLSIDVYYNSIGNVSHYHSDPTNCYYDGISVCMFPRAIHALATGVLSNLDPMLCGDPAFYRAKYMRKFNMMAMISHKDHVGSGNDDKYYTYVSYPTSLIKLINYL